MISVHLGISNVGYELLETIDKFGNLYITFEYLNNPIWRELFEKNSFTKGDLYSNMNKYSESPKKYKEQLEYLLINEVLNNIVTQKKPEYELTNKNLKNCQQEIWVLGSLARKDMFSFIWTAQTDMYIER